jgi:predicted alpha/beta superfamily hydrolase
VWLLQQSDPFLDVSRIYTIQANYRIDSKDTSVLGHSFGGLFALYALLKAPDTFNRYIISSPSIWWNPQTIFEYEENLASEHSDLSAKVFLSAGTLEESMQVPVRGVPARFVTNIRLWPTSCIVGVMRTYR